MEIFPTDNNAHSSRDTSEDSDDEIGKLIYKLKSRTRKTGAEAENCCE